MSRIGKMPIPVPAGVDLNIEDHKLTVKGPKGTLERELHPDMSVRVDDGLILVERPSESKNHMALHGLTRALVANMVEGVTNGYHRRLQVVGVGYRAEVDGKDLVLQVGLSNQVRVSPDEGISFEAGRITDVREFPPQIDSREQVFFVDVQGIDKEVVGQQAAEIRKIRPPEPYKGKGIRYSGERVRRKAGKAGKVGA